MNTIDGCSDVLLGMLQMPGLMSRAATDSQVVLTAATAVAEAYGQPVPAGTSSGTADSHHMDALHADAAAAHHLQSHMGFSSGPHEVGLTHMKKAAKSGKGGCFGAILDYLNSAPLIHKSSLPICFFHVDNKVCGLAQAADVFFTPTFHSMCVCVATCTGGPKKKPGQKRQQLVCKVRCKWQHVVCG